MVRRPRLPEQVLAGAERQNLAGREQLAQLVVAEPVEKGEGAQIVEVHRIPGGGGYGWHTHSAR